jgi:putative ABC transport system ATP-binding protein
VAIARALITTPSILLADEPTGNLDTESSREIMSILEELNREGITVILVTHEADIAAYARREILLKDGQLLSDRATRRASGPVEV